MSSEESVKTSIEGFQGNATSKVASYMECTYNNKECEARVAVCET
jgi:hypothetical protein